VHIQQVDMMSHIAATPACGFDMKPLAATTPHRVNTMAFQNTTVAKIRLMCQVFVLSLSARG
jgi:hypothetical protein